MRPGVRSCPGRGPGRGLTAEGGTANGSREVAGAIAKHRKSRSRSQHTCKCKQQVLQAVPLGPEPGRTLLQTQRHCPASGVKPSRAAEPGSRGWTFSHNAQSSCLAQSRRRYPGRKLRRLDPSPFSLNYSLNCCVLFGPGCLFETGTSLRAEAHLL